MQHTFGFSALEPSTPRRGWVNCYIISLALLTSIAVVRPNCVQ